MPLLEVSDLTVAIPTRRGDVHAVRGISFEVDAGGTIGIVGESGCGKTMSGLAVVGLTPPGTRVGGSILFDGLELVGLPERRMLRLRGGDVGMVFQDPFTALNPLMTVGAQVAEAVRLHRQVSRRGAWEAAVEALSHVHLPAPAEIARRYPHQLSGGQRQRVVVAMALACRPRLVIADEPTTALDVTLQAQILALLRELQSELGLASIFISHDLAVVGALCDMVLVMYAGKTMEYGAPADVIGLPEHPYTVGLLNSLPRESGRFSPIPGQPPSLLEPPASCPFEPRCPARSDRCAEMPPLAGADGHLVACWHPRRGEVDV
jgi:oligopeptide/dipeptide ABC transporter ATP-binding protein